MGHFNCTCHDLSWHCRHTTRTQWASVSDGPVPGARHPGIYPYRRRVRRRHQLYISVATHLTTCFLFMNCAAHRVVFSICHDCSLRCKFHFQDTSCQGRPKQVQETNTIECGCSRLLTSPKDNPINTQIHVYNRYYNSDYTPYYQYCILHIPTWGSISHVNGSHRYLCHITSYFNRQQFIL